MARKVGKLTLAEARDLLCLYAAAQDATALGATEVTPFGLREPVVR